MKNICFKSDGTKETGEKIINTLISLGGVNYYTLEGTLRGNVYYIDYNNVIKDANYIPNDYTLLDIHTYIHTK